MSKTINLRGQPVHFIGVGGIGMSALAYILAERNIPVSGSDVRSTHITQRLEAAGASIFTEQRPENLAIFQQPVQMGSSPPSPQLIHGNKESVNGNKGNVTSLATLPKSEVNAPQVVCSTAIHNSNAEYCAALERGYPIFHRSDVLAALMHEYESIAVAGTHGKTTTSSLIAYILLHAGVDPTVVVGGEIEAIGGNARLGQGHHLVAEADESDGSLVKMHAAIGVITNIELDHPDHYSDLEAVIEVFKTFERHSQTVVACVDCNVLRDNFQPHITYSLAADRAADYTAQNIKYHSTGTHATILERGQVLGEIDLPLLGSHNLSNTLAAIAVARYLELPFAAIAAAIAQFQGPKRRFELRGQVKGITFIDDYAHHPSELQATLAAARLRIETPNGNTPHRLIAVFQPHRYSRTATFFEDFAQSFGAADVVVITEIYSAGETNTKNISGQQLADAIANHHAQVVYQPTVSEVGAFLQKSLQPGDFVLFLGAGNLNQQIPPLIEYYTHHQV
ncbi:MAG: UDP-N-acetylmuramate--L-alanine ligase [Spirulina sp. SIO3F2]|nr:UDP-N-acetylmuramate--L-alanine ligase [Spirulina sp. SIO3F2]